MQMWFDRRITVRIIAARRLRNGRESAEGSPSLLQRTSPVMPIKLVKSPAESVVGTAKIGRGTLVRGGISILSGYSNLIAKRSNCSGVLMSSASAQATALAVSLGLPRRS
jgi:hypothetical protein